MMSGGAGSGRWGWRFAATLAACAALLASMALPRMAALRFGVPVLLETVPVDPRSILSGDYVRLNYRISRVEVPEARWEEIGSAGGGSKVRVLLERDPESKRGFWRAADIRSAAAFSGEGSGVWISGRLVGRGGSVPLRGRPGPAGSDVRTVTVSYGIEERYIAEGTGAVWEDRSKASDVTVRVWRGRAALEKVELRPAEVAPAAGRQTQPPGP